MSQLVTMSPTSVQEMEITVMDLIKALSKALGQVDFADIITKIMKKNKSKKILKR